jgi:hypothetical protein
VELDAILTPVLVSFAPRDVDHLLRAINRNDLPPLGGQSNGVLTRAAPELEHTPGAPKRGIEARPHHRAEYLPDGRTGKCCVVIGRQLVERPRVHEWLLETVPL